ncbi:MAG: hypothetical protein WCR72_07145 [Bacteroidota bacterium]
MKAMQKMTLLLFLMTIYFSAFAQKKSIIIESIPVSGDEAMNYYNKVILLDSVKKSRTSIDLFEMNPYNHFRFNSIGKGFFNGNREYFIDQKDFQKMFPENFKNDYKSEYKEQGVKFDSLVLTSKISLSNFIFNNINYYNYLAIGFSMKVKPVNGEIIAGTKSTVYAINATGKTLYENETSKYVNSVAITNDGQLLAFSYNSGWADDELYPSGICIIDISNGNTIYEKNEGIINGVWQIKGAIGWDGIMDGMRIDFYYLETGKIILIQNELPEGIIEITENTCTFIKDDGSTFSRKIQEGINIISN